MKPLSIAEILHPIPVAQFLETYWGRQFLVQAGDPGRFASLVNWESIGASLRDHSWQSPAIRIFANGSAIDQSEFLREEDGFGSQRVTRVLVEAVEQRLSRGALLSLNWSDHRFPAIRRLAREFEYGFRERTQANIYAGYSQSKGFQPHWDDHEAFVLQVSGRKLWRIYGRTSEAPLYRDLLPDETPPSEVVWSGELEAGGLLYIPRGVWHDAEAKDEPTIHLTVGLDCATGIDLLAWMQKELRASAAFRTDLPRLATAASQREHAVRLLEEIIALLDETVVERFLAADDLSAPAVRVGGLTGSAGDGKLRWLPPRPVAIAVEETLGRFIELDCLGQHWHLPRWTEPVVRLIAEEREITRQEICQREGNSLSARDVDEAVTYLIQKGLIEEGGAA